MCSLFTSKVGSYTVYSLTSSELLNKLRDLKLSVPMGMLDGTYYYTNKEGWANILYHLVFSSSLYKANKFDCENYAIKAMSNCAENYGLNTFGVCIGNIPEGRHGFNIFYTGEDFMLFEPNSGFGYGGAFEIGEYGYKPDLVLI